MSADEKIHPAAGKGSLLLIGDRPTPVDTSGKTRGSFARYTADERMVVSRWGRCSSGGHGSITGEDSGPVLEGDMSGDDNRELPATGSLPFEQGASRLGIGAGRQVAP